MSLEQFRNWFDVLASAEALDKTHAAVVAALGGEDKAKQLGIKTPAETRVLLYFMREANSAHSPLRYLDGEAVNMKVFWGLANIEGGYAKGQNPFFEIFLRALMVAWGLESTRSNWESLACAVAIQVCELFDKSDITASEAAAREQADEDFACSFP